MGIMISIDTKEISRREVERIVFKMAKSLYGEYGEQLRFAILESELRKNILKETSGGFLDEEDGGLEMKKDLAWLKEEVKNCIEPYDEEDWLSYKAGTTDVAELILGYIDQVEQPETLSQEWIDDHEKRERLTGPLGNVYLQHVVPSMYLQNLLVPKQEVNLKIQELIEKYEQEDGEHSNPENAWIDDFIADLEDVKHFPKQEEVDRAYKDGYEKGKQHTFYKGYLEGLADKENEPETVADVVTTFWKSFERLKEVMSMEVKELEE